MDARNNYLQLTLFFFKNQVAPIFYIGRVTFTDVHNDIGGTSQTKQWVGKHLGYSSKPITVISKAVSKAHDTTAQCKTTSSRDTKQPDISLFEEDRVGTTADLRFDLRLKQNYGAYVEFKHHYTSNHLVFAHPKRDFVNHFKSLSWLKLCSVS